MEVVFGGSPALVGARGRRSQRTRASRFAPGRGRRPNGAGLGGTGAQAALVSEPTRQPHGSRLDRAEVRWTPGGDPFPRQRHDPG